MMSCQLNMFEGPADMISKEEVRQAIQDLKVRESCRTKWCNC